MTNPLVAQAPEEGSGFTKGTGDNGWATGVSIAESAMDTFNGFKEGNWIEGGLGVVSLAADAASMAIDPFGTLMSSAASFLMEHVQPLKDMLDWLAGDPPVIESYSTTWNNVATELGKISEDYATALKSGTEGWTGAAADAYRGSAAEQSDAITGAASAAGSVGTVVGVMGMVVAFVREMVRDLIADLIAKLIAWVLEAVFSLGFGTPVIVAQAVTAIGKWAARIAKLVQKLLDTIKKVSPMLKRLVEIFEKIMKVLGKLAGKATGLDVLGTKIDDPGFLKKLGRDGPDLPSTSHADAPTSPSSTPGTSTDTSSSPAGRANADSPPSSRPADSTAPSSTAPSTAPPSSTPDGPAATRPSSTPGSPSPSPSPSTSSTPSPSSAGRAPGGPASPAAHSPSTTSPAGHPSSSTPSPAGHAPGGSPSSPAAHSPTSPAGHSPGGSTPGGHSPSSPSSAPSGHSPSSPSPTPSGHSPGGTSTSPAGSAPARVDQTHSSATEAPSRTDQPHTAPRDAGPAQAPQQGAPAPGGGAPHGGGQPGGTSPSAGSPRPGGGGWTGTPGHRGDLSSGTPQGRAPDGTRPQSAGPSHAGPSHAGPPQGRPPQAGPPPYRPAQTGPQYGGPPHAGPPQARPSGPPQTRPGGPPHTNPPHTGPSQPRPNTGPPQHAPQARGPQTGAPPHHAPAAPHQNGPNTPPHHDPNTPDPTHHTPDHHTPDQHRPDIDEAHARYGETTPAGVSHHRGDPAMGDLPSRVPNDPRYFTADVHITPDGRARVGNHAYSPEEYGDLLRRNGWDGKTPIRLIGCDAGSNDFAKRLSAHTDAPVLAPTKPAWTDSNGRVYTSDAEVDAHGNRQPRIPPNGEWETHSPDGTRVKSSEDGFAPGTHDRDKSGLAPDGARDRAATTPPETVPVGRDHPDAPLKSRPFGRDADGDPVRMEPNTRYEVTDRAGRDRGVFTTDGEGNVVRVETTSGRQGDWRPDSRQPFPNCEYRVTGQAGSVYTFHTDADARTSRMTGDLVHTGSDSARRSPDQGPVGHEGRDEYRAHNQQVAKDFEDRHGRPPEPHEVRLYEDVGWNGGHLAGTEFDGPGEYVNMVPMLESLNQHQPGSTLADNFRALEEHWGDVLSRDPKPKLTVQVEMDYPDGKKTPDSIHVQYWIDGVPEDPLVYNNIPPRRH
ncbi:DNA/RNA non-specific endonuclease [Umezawaea sp. Da 62-37]|uniref:DNA/RNA non-specific endonuclease n=1 Tax=Umezawaea sp. Da 62-37 TaxID=3075927 RepID=UPI0028F70636|nr:DNA/RNA non-specific endonuclease [Umezawaea sp. Da 62-37]WNV89513.1 DNA/RNA non-specific endonuclease [Umezawaea sp. Da 62-37]